MQEALQALNAGVPQIDAFATSQNTRCSLHWDVNNSAFERNWQAQGLLWINPPFDLLGQVAEKVETDQAECLLLCRNWRTAPWFDKLQKMAQRMYSFVHP